MKFLESIRSKRFIGLTGVQIVVLGGLIATLFLFSENNVFNWIKYESQIRSLESEIEYYQHRTEVERAKLNELQSNREDLEKFARENFLMKRDNEDLFLIID